MTPTSPLPAVTRPLSWLIAEKLLSNAVTLSPDGTVAPPPPADGEVVELLELPHAASSATPASTAPWRAVRQTPCDKPIVRTSNDRGQLRLLPCDDPTSLHARRSDIWSRRARPDQRKLGSVPPR